MQEEIAIIRRRSSHIPALAIAVLAAAVAGLPAGPAAQQQPVPEPPAAKQSVPEPPVPAPETSPASIQWNDGWSADLFKRATAENKPVLLYVRTAWSRSSLWNDEKNYTDPRLVKIVNDKWIPVRIERDRRPDIDQRYQIAVNAVTKGEGGWPLVAMLSDTGEAMSGRGYLQLEDVARKAGLRTLLDRTADYYANNRDKMPGLHLLVMRSFDKEREIYRTGEITPAVIDEVVSGMLKGFDPESGGFGPPPRVLIPYPVELAATLHHRTGDQAMLDLMVKTLSGLERGAIHDHIEGGFHRSAGDASWHSPEFEKLLNYNAPMLVDYLLGYQATGDPDYKQAAEGIVDYVLKTLTDPAGGFYSAQWAGSRAEDPRGDYYAFTQEDFRKAVPAGSEAIADTLFNVKAEGELLIGPPPRSLMYLTMSRKAAADRLGISEKAVREAEAGIITALRRLRASRTPPPVEKVIYVDSCSSMALAMIEAHRVLGRRDALDAGTAALDRLLAAVPKDGPLLHRVQPPPEKGVDPSLAMDHMMLARAALAGYEATGHGKYLDAARGLIERAMTPFWDTAAGGFFDIVADPDAVGFMSVRRRLPNDTAYPSLNSLAARVLDRLWLLTGEASYHTRAQACLKGLISTSEKLDQHDAGLALAVASALWPPTRYVVVATADDDAKAQALAAAADRLYDPGKIVVRLMSGRDDGEISRLKLDRKARKAYAVVCREDRCSEPVRDEASLKEKGSLPAPGGAVEKGTGGKP